MSAPPGDPNPSAAPKQPLPSEPLPTTPKPTTAAPKRARQPRRPDESAARDDDHRPPTTPDAAPPPPPPLVHHHHYSTPPGPVFQPYHHPYPLMNPPYPVNGSPYPQHHHPAYSPNPNAPPHPHAPPQYSYPMHPGGYPSYPPYPQYHHQPMMMYPPQQPRQGVPETPQQPPAQPAASSGTKRKRKGDPGRAGDKNSDDEAPPSASEPGRLTHAQQQANDLKKRTKTQRACDSCRSRKIRCDILPDTEPQVCQHCKQYSFECTFFLPITETRFKKKKIEEDSTPAEKEKDKQIATAIASSSATHDTRPKQDVAVLGPTAPPYLLHSQASISSRVYENYDQRYNHTFQVSNSGDGFIQVQKPNNEEQHVAQPKPIDVHVERDVIESLINAYFSDIAPMLPIISKSEFLATPNPPPVLLYSMCLVAAARREVPPQIFDSIRYTVNNIIKAEDVLSTATIVNVQALLILCMTGDCHSQFVPSALSALWIRLGSAIRMAQDLGLHRAESVNSNIEQRRRLWGACLICDRWASIAYGHPSMIDVQDCDARLPSSGELTDLYLDELVRLSIILGRVQKTIYTPSGLTFTTDDMLYELLADMQRWKEGLPDNLRFNGPDSPRNAGLLHLLYSCVCMMFWRVFMRISYSCPTHLKFSLTVEQWSELVTLTGECIDWLDANERVYDVWLLIAYAVTSCALVQYHTFIRRKDPAAQDKLRKLRDCVRRWEGSISPDHMSARRKTAEIISLLFEATQGPAQPLETPALNPTGGVRGNPPVMLDYRKDPTRPGGGVFVAQDTGHARETLRDLPAGVVVSASEIEEDDDAAGSIDGDGQEVEQQVQVQAASGGEGAPAPMVNMTPLSVGTAGSGRGGQYSNVNPAMNLQASQSGGTSVQVMNILDGSQSGSAMADMAMADNGYLEGIPGGMFDWGQWDTFFSRFAAQGGNTSATGMSAFTQHQQQQQQMAQQQQQKARLITDVRSRLPRDLPSWALKSHSYSTVVGEDWFWFFLSPLMSNFVDLTFVVCARRSMTFMQAQPARPLAQPVYLASYVLKESTGQMDGNMNHSPGSSASSSAGEDHEHTPEEMVEEGLQMLRAAVDALKKLTIKDENRMREWEKEIEELRKTKKDKLTSVLIALCGVTGAGKSSLWNAVLEDNIVPTSGVQACTSVVTKISYHKHTTIRADVTFLSVEEWTQELNFVLCDLEDNPEGCKTGDSEAAVAWQKLHAIYPALSLEALITMDAQQVMSTNLDVAEKLGTVETVSGNDSAEFSEKIARYIDSSEAANPDGDPNAVALWPLIKEVHIRCKSDALSTGAVIVDLPGAADSNAARNRVAQDYLKQAKRIWILAEASRAVSNKIAQDLLGDSFRRQLQMDDSYSDITFIISKTDDISCAEVASSLRLNTKGEYREIQSRISDIEGKRKALMNERKTLGKRLKAVSDRIHALEQEGLHARNVLSDGLGHPVLQQKSPVTSHRKRKPDQNATRLKAGPSKLPRRNLNEDVSRNTPWNTLADTDSNEQTSQSVTEPEVEQAGAPGMNEASGIESTQVQKTSEPRNAEEKLLGFRQKRDELDEKERVVAVKLADLAEELRKVQKEKNACCSLARNEHTMRMLKAQFRAGIQEMDDMSEEDQESEDGHSRNRRDYESIDLPVFACSSRDYMRLTGQLQGDGEASCFSKLGDTGIPAVQKWCHDLTLGYRREAAEEFLTRLDDLTRNVKMYVEHMQNGYISGVNRNTVRSKWDSSIAVEGVSRRLKREFSVLAEKYISDLQKCFKDGLEEKLRAGAESAADLALDTIDRFGKIHHATYRATIRHYGCFKLGDLNFELVDPFTQSIAKSFSATFKKAILGRLDIRLRKVLTALLDEFQASVGPATGELSSLTRKQGGSCQTALKTVWQSTMASIDQTVSSKGKDISRSIAPIIQDRLHFTYEEARDESGRGTTGRQKEHIRRFVEQNKDTMFQDVADDILKALDNIAAVIRGTLRRSLDSLADKIELRLAVLWEEVHTGADEKAAREKAMKLMTQIKDRISFYLHTPEDDPLQYEEDKDMDLF